MVQPQYLVVLVLDRVVQGLQGQPEAVLVAVVAELPGNRLQQQLMVMPVLRELLLFMNTVNRYPR
jgi:hypothetical protein